VWTHVVSVHQELRNFTLQSVMDGKSDHLPGYAVLNCEPAAKFT
jgi:hypothetical protein